MQEITVTDMHTGGEPLRIIEQGYPAIQGHTILEKRRFVQTELDHLRQLLMFEPRGHRDMYGALLVESHLPDADFGVLFLHNEGYSTMCGHAVIALGRYAVDKQLVTVTEPLTRVGIECPCGLVEAWVEVKDGKAQATYFDSVPSFLFQPDLPLTLSDGRACRVDIAYGGAFYALLDVHTLGMNLHDTPLQQLTQLADEVVDLVKRDHPLHHPDHDDLAFLYGAILTDGKDAHSNEATRNLCVFADSQVDRSPTGSGVCARLAMQHHKQLITVGQPRHFESITGSQFIGTVQNTTSLGNFPAIIGRVAGQAHYMAKTTFCLEADDPFQQGFFLR